MKNQQLIIFTRYPEPGTTKTNDTKVRKKIKSSSDYQPNQNMKTVENLTKMKDRK